MRTLPWTIDLAVTPERLSKVYNSRSVETVAIALKAAFFDISDGVAMLLPQIKPIGDFSDDNSVNDADFVKTLFSIEADLPPPISVATANYSDKTATAFSAWGRYPHIHKQCLANSH